jgi:hypothetical protein
MRIIRASFAVFVLAAVAIVVGPGPARADDSVQVLDLTMTANPNTSQFGQEVVVPLDRQADLFSISVPAGLSALAYIVNGATCPPGEPFDSASWTHCVEPYSPNPEQFWIIYRDASNVTTIYDLAGDDFPVTVTDLTTGQSSTGTVRVRASADLRLFGPYVDGPTATMVNGGIFYTVENFGPSRSDSTTLTITINGDMNTPSLPSACSRSGQTIRCSLGTMTPGNVGPASTQVTVPLGQGTGDVTFDAVVTSNESDPDTSNNKTSSAPLGTSGNTPPGTGTGGGQSSGGGTGHSTGSGTASQSGATAQPRPTTSASALTAPASPTTSVATADAADSPPPPSAARLASASFGITGWAVGISSIVAVLVAIGAPFAWSRRRRASGIGEPPADPVDPTAPIP